MVEQIPSGLPPVKRSIKSPPVAVALMLAVAASLHCSSSPTEPIVTEPPAVGEQPVEASIETVATEEVDRPVRRVIVQIYYPAAGGRALIGESHEIFMTPAPGDRAKQILADLISGPIGTGRLKALSPHTQLRQVYVLDDGTAYADFSEELKHGISGGSTKELLTIYSIVNSVTLNIPEIRRLGILIDGEPITTLNGHLNLRRPLTPNMSIIVR